MQLLFNHIPKTGGVTLRIILNRVYGADKIFLIKSTDIKGSLETFSKLPVPSRENYAAIVGHGAELFRDLIGHPFRVTILREPVSLFLSQYYYLRISTDSNFRDEVSALGSIEEYVDYAIAKGQDNLLTRYLSNAVRFLIDPGSPVPAMLKEGDQLLKTARQALNNYDLAIDLADFDHGVYKLAEKLKWKKIPIYRPFNVNRNKPDFPQPSGRLLKHLQEVLKWDLALYENFLSDHPHNHHGQKNTSLNYRKFMLRQQGVRFMARLLHRK